MTVALDRHPGARDLEAEAAGLRAVAGRFGQRGARSGHRIAPRPGLFHGGRGRVAAGPQLTEAKSGPIVN